MDERLDGTPSRSAKSKVSVIRPEIELWLKNPHPVSRLYGTVFLLLKINSEVVLLRK
jgi:hypothetical protein